MDIAFTLSILLALGIGAQWFSWFLKQPSILALLFIGILVGPILGFFNPDEVLGDLLFPFISLGVAIILFEGSLTLRLNEIKQHGIVVQNLVSIGVLVTIAVLSIASYFLFDMDPKIALLFGALVCVTGPTVITPLLRNIRLKKNISNVLKWEGIIVDPIGAIAVVLVYEYIVTGGDDSSVLLFLEMVTLSTIIGAISATILAFLIIRFWVPKFLHSAFTLTFVLLSFSISNHLEHESGLLTVTVMGVILANWKHFPRQTLLEFHEAITILLLSMLFIILAARIDLNAMFALSWRGILILLIAMFIARPLAVWISSIGSPLTQKDKLMVSWIGPRGIVAAAVSSLFAIRLQDYDLAGVELLVPLVFIIIIGTVVIQGLSAKAVGDYLNVREPSDTGVLIIGGNPVALTIGEAIKNLGFDVKIADASYVNISRAHMRGLKTYYGNPVSDHAELHMDLIGFGKLFALSTDRELNSLCDLYFRHDFGETNIYRIKLADEKTSSEPKRQDPRMVSQWLFGQKNTYNKLASLIAKNAIIKNINITKKYTYEQFKKDNPKAIPLFVMTKNNDFKVITDQFKVDTLNEYKLVTLTLDNSEENPKVVKNNNSMPSPNLPD